MNGLTRLSFVVIATLAVWVVPVIFHPAIADPAVASGDAFAETASPAGLSAAGDFVATVPGRVYLFRGALGLIFSRGMDGLTKRLRSAGIRADVYEFTICGLIADQAVRDFRDHPAPIILIGHSMGGLCALKFAETLQEANIAVSLVVTIDPAHASPKVPLNVERYVNIFLSNSILGGGDVVARQGYQGYYASFDLSRQTDVTHTNIDKMDTIHAQLVDTILRLVTVPTKAQGEALPLRYIVPADAPLEIWDNATALFARSGDTLQTLAALHRLPLWSLTQLNRLPEGAALTDGQRVIIPQHLMPMVAISEKPKPTMGQTRGGRNGMIMGTRRQ